MILIPSVFQSMFRQVIRSVGALSLTAAAWSAKLFAQLKSALGLSSGFFQETGLKHEIAGIHTAIDFMTIRALAEPNAFYLGAFLEHDGRPLHFQILDQDNGIAIGQRIAVGIADHAI